MRLRKPEPLAAHHDTASFESGEPSIDAWLRDMALYNQEQNYPRTFVVTATKGRVVGYRAMCTASIHRTDLPRSQRGRNPLTDIPCALIARMGVHRTLQGNGLGAELLTGALIDTVSAAQTIAFRAVLVHALSPQAAAFYRRFGFEPLPKQPLTLFLPTIDILASLRGAGPKEAK